MFNSLYGTITHKQGSALNILTGGIEWELSIPSIDAAALPDVNSEARVYTWLLHREDAMTLFGFAAEERRDMFLALLKVDGIGAKGAIKIMSGITLEDMERAIELEDLARLEAVPGLGKKTAQKLMLAMKGKIVKHEAESLSPYTDIAAALADMGYDKRRVNEALVKAASSTTGKESDTESEIFSLALSYLNS